MTTRQVKSFSPCTSWRFVSVVTEASRSLPALPVVMPRKGKWLVRVIACANGFVFGEYRRHMKTIGYLGRWTNSSAAR
jgi:hypothetical protein